MHSLSWTILTHITLHKNMGLSSEVENKMSVCVSCGIRRVLKEHLVHHKDVSLLNICTEKDQPIKMCHRLSVTQ